MKILIINTRYFVSGGPERYMFDLIEYLEKNNHEVIPFSVKSHKNKPTPYEKYFVDPMGGQDEALFDNLKMTPKMAVDVISRLFYSFQARKKLKKLIQDEQPDIAYILNHYNKLSPSIIDAAKKYEIPVVVRLSDYFLVCPQAHLVNGANELCQDCIIKGYYSCTKNKCIKNSYLASVLKTIALTMQTKILKTYNKVDKFVCTNEFMKQKMLEKGYPLNKLQVIPTFKQKPTSKNDAIKEIPKKFVLYFGRFGNEKAVDTLVHAYIKSKLYHEDIKLVLIGGEKQDINLELIDVEQEVIKKEVLIYPFKPKDEIDAYIQHALFVVHTSRWYENMPNSILEALSFNKAVITADIGSLPYIINEKVGMLYKYENIDDLAHKLRLMSKDEIRLPLEKNIPEYFKSFSIEKHYSDLLHLFNKTQ
jgi:glycosyltransferase involved in cell wall biosynthesis